MTERSSKNNPLYFITGLVLCLLCVMCIGVLVYALVSTSAEKARLESIGATVTMRFTWLFFVDIIVFIVSGITGVHLLGKHKEMNREPTVKTPPEAIPVSPVTPMIPPETLFVKPEIMLDEPTVPSSGSLLRINIGGSVKKPVSGDVGVSVHVDNPPKTKGSEFFSSGDDL